MNSLSYEQFLADHSIITTLLWLASLVHVGIESTRYKRVGRPFWHIALAGLACWPFGYLLWVFYWPGTLLKTKAQLDSEAWVEDLFRRKTACGPRVSGIDKNQRKGKT